MSQISASEAAASKLVAQCDEAYRITTTVGLAAAFYERRAKIAWSMWFWVAGLVAALLGAGWLGHERYAALAKVLADPQIGMASVSLHMLISILSVGAPFWFAWVATVQIGQRFRLAEDYGFKASVARAYEGYRKEAAHLDPQFEARLFAIALDRLEQEPLRLVAGSEHGSPIHAFFASAEFKRAMDAVPEAKDRFVDTMKGAADRLGFSKGVGPKASPESSKVTNAD